MRYLLSTVRGTEGTGRIVAPSDGQRSTLASSHRPQRGHSIIGSIGCARSAHDSRPIGVVLRARAGAAAQSHDVEAERHLCRDAGQELTILSGVGFLRTTLAERDHGDERAILADDRHEQHRAGAFEPFAFVGRQPARG